MKDEARGDWEMEMVGGRTKWKKKKIRKREPVCIPHDFILPSHTLPHTQRTTHAHGQYALGYTGPMHPAHYSPFCSRSFLIHNAICIETTYTFTYTSHFLT